MCKHWPAHERGRLMLNQVFLLQQLDVFIRGDNWRRAGHYRLGDSGTICGDITVGRRTMMRL